MYDTPGLLKRFRFPSRELLEVISEFNDDLQYLASTKQREVCLLLFVAGAVLVCISLYFDRAKLLFFSLHGVYVWKL